jgi:hypothetical protein
LDAPVPKPWSAFINGDNEVYYFNMETGDERFDHPLDDFYKNKLKQAKLEA